MGRRGQQASRVDVAAINAAQPMINGYRGAANISGKAAAFARDVARDALFAAPQPVTESWVRGALSMSAGLAQWCIDTAQPLTRDHVLAQRTRQRFLFGTGSAAEKVSRRTYQSRLDRIGTALLAPPTYAVPNVVGLGAHVRAPLTPHQQADVWAWAQGMSPRYRRRRLLTILALTMGTGARRMDLFDLPAANITRDEHGVHVRFCNGAGPRTVTCRSDWEHVLWDLVEDLAPEQQVVGDRQTRPIDGDAFDQVVESAQKVSPPPVAFNVTHLRHSWIVHHLQVGTPLAVLLPAAHIAQAATLIKLLPHVTPPSPSEQWAALRRAAV